MKILVIGGGGREHALVWKLSQSPRVEEICCAPGNAGIAGLARCVPIAATDLGGLLSFALKEKFDLTVVGPDDPLALGIVDTFEENGLRVFGPNKACARLESSKVFAKNLMVKYGIPTAQYRSFNNVDEASDYVRSCALPVVVKADGLALGKGVLICGTREEAVAAVEKIMVERAFGDAGAHVVVEEFLVGREVSVLAFCDGETVAPMVSARDYKRVFDGDKGANTGGMGCVSPCEYFTGDIQAACMEGIFLKTMDALRGEGLRYRGVLYFGLMLTNSGEVKLLEYNSRFGDPEAQVVLPRLQSDLLPILETCVDGTLGAVEIRWDDNAAVCVALASGGYPGSCDTGKPITGLEEAEHAGGLVFHAGTKREDNVTVTAGGRVIGVTGRGETVGAARDAAYRAAEYIGFEGCHKRSDIAGGSL